MLLGLIDDLISPSTSLILYLFLTAYAITLLALSCDTMCLFNSATSLEGVHDASISVFNSASIASASDLSSGGS